MKPALNLNVSRELMNTQAQYQAALGGASNTSFVVMGVNPAPVLMGLSGNLELMAGKNLSLFIGYSGYFSGTETLNTFSGGGNINF